LTPGLSLFDIDAGPEPSLSDDVSLPIIDWPESCHLTDGFRTGPAAPRRVTNPG